ncbi:MAG: hypothetical protein A2174_03045 [Candidatus Portnoybacteria bacterium RBG_13_41_18]|uniref:RanBP2-type domain-containing protein n=1 Tax=Candidatus Portnoybacteria bacterium RBG_13_41_18 TaxID=1801991 RepID=A0A1G2F869_9BACT|nr:MAG: hypothetical protein A2174_03045 [Candidatus Portnoybacteria bacterium RBG_13_41_18]
MHKDIVDLDLVKKKKRSINNIGKKRVPGGRFNVTQFLKWKAKEKPGNQEEEVVASEGNVYAFPIRTLVKELWICRCGEENSKDSDECWRCKRDRPVF